MNTVQRESELYTELGNTLIHVLQLPIKTDNGRVDTVWGDKTPEGLARTVIRIINAHVTPND